MGNSASKSDSNIQFNSSSSYNMSFRSQTVGHGVGGTGGVGSEGGTGSMSRSASSFHDTTHSSNPNISTHHNSLQPFGGHNSCNNDSSNSFQFPADSDCGNSLGFTTVAIDENGAPTSGLYLPISMDTACAAWTNTLEAGSTTALKKKLVEKQPVWSRLKSPKCAEQMHLALFVADKISEDEFQERIRKTIGEPHLFRAFWAAFKKLRQPDRTAEGETHALHSEQQNNGSNSNSKSSLGIESGGSESRRRAKGATATSIGRAKSITKKNSWNVVAPSKEVKLEMVSKHRPTNHPPYMPVSPSLL